MILINFRVGVGSDEFHSRLENEKNVFRSIRAHSMLISGAEYKSIHTDFLTLTCTQLVPLSPRGRGKYALQPASQALTASR